MKGLGKMKKLRYLQVYFRNQDYYERNAGFLDDTSQYFSKSLKYLNCVNYPFLYLPKTFQANNLVELHMWNTRMEQLWEEGEKKVEYIIVDWLFRNNAINLLVLLIH